MMRAAPLGALSLAESAMSEASSIRFVDLQRQRQRLGARLEQAIAHVLAHGRFIMGPEVEELEARLATFCGARHAIACGSGTDALALGLMAKGIGPGDAVLVPAFTFVATAEMVAWIGATPVFVDVRPDTFDLDPAAIEGGIRSARAAGLTPRAVIAVDLYGQPADYDALEPLCAEHGLWLLADAAQSFGASHGGRRVGRFGAVTATSFYPSKPLGCYGDGGCVLTDDDSLAEAVVSLRDHGQRPGTDDAQAIGINGRLDTLQAAILLTKLEIFDDEIAARQAIARRYHDALGDVVQVPQMRAGATSVWASYTILIENDRDALAAALRADGIPTRIYYPIPLHHQAAYRRFPAAEGGLAVAEQLAARVLSLPIHPYLDAATQDRVVARLRQALGST